MVRYAIPGDLERIAEIYDTARKFMRKNNNMTQWQGGYPDAVLLREDIAKKQLYVLTENGEDEADKESIYAVFALIAGEDPTYGYIEGMWHSDTPYATIHRIAGDGRYPGVFETCVKFAEKQYCHLRVDTHEDNKIMQHVIGKVGFLHAGTIYLANGSPRLAFDRIQPLQ